MVLDKGRKQMIKTQRIKRMTKKERLKRIERNRDKIKKLNTKAFRINFKIAELETDNFLLKNYEKISNDIIPTDIE